MADNNNARAGSLPKAPHPALMKLDRLTGIWDVSGPSIGERVRFEWMEGRFFLIQHVDLSFGGRPIKGIEYIGYDEDTRTLRSHYMDDHGSNFTYTWDIDGDTLVVWFGDKGSDNHLRARIDPSGDRYAGAWQWPGGGYELAGTRVR